MDDGAVSFEGTTMAKSASVILSMFDQPRAFNLSLSGYMRQSCKDFEIVVADDGSDREVADLIESYRRLDIVPIKHVRQENRGYRRSKIANKAFSVSEGKHIILSDGDCVPHGDLVKNHLAGYRPGAFCVGGYIRLSYEESMSLTRELVEQGAHERHLTFLKRLRHWGRHLTSLYQITVKKRRRPKAYGSNIGVAREVYEGVNGYDENFDGFGKEDSDLRNRFLLYGAKPVSLWNKIFVFHLDHKIDVKRSSQPHKARVKNRDYYYREGVAARCENGIVKYGKYADSNSLLP